MSKTIFDWCPECYYYRSGCYKWTGDRREGPFYLDPDCGGGPAGEIPDGWRLDTTWEDGADSALRETQADALADTY